MVELEFNLILTHPGHPQFSQPPGQLPTSKAGGIGDSQNAGPIRSATGSYLAHTHLSIHYLDMCLTYLCFRISQSPHNVNATLPGSRKRPREMMSGWSTKKFACSVCSKQFESRNKLDTHFRVHTGTTLQQSPAF